MRGRFSAVEREAVEDDGMGERKLAAVGTGSGDATAGGEEDATGGGGEGDGATGGCDEGVDAAIGAGADERGEVAAAHFFAMMRARAST